MQLSSPSVVYKTVQLYCIFIKIVLRSYISSLIWPNPTWSGIYIFHLNHFPSSDFVGSLKMGKYQSLVYHLFCIFIKVSLFCPLIFIFPFTPHRERLYWKISTPGPQHWLTKHTLLFLYLIRSVCQTQIQILVKI